VGPIKIVREEPSFLELQFSEDGMEGYWRLGMWTVIALGVLLGTAMVQSIFVGYYGSLPLSLFVLVLCVPCAYISYGRSFRKTLILDATTGLVSYSGDLLRHRLHTRRLIEVSAVMFNVLTGQIGPWPPPKVNPKKKLTLRLHVMGLPLANQRRESLILWVVIRERFEKLDDLHKRLMSFFSRHGLAVRTNPPGTLAAHQEA
jgi:hypothetical protein